MFRTTYDGCRVIADNLADNQPVEQHPHGRQVLLNARRRVGFAQLLDIGRHMHRLKRLKLLQTYPVGPAEEIRHCPQVRSPGIAVSDVSSEKLNEPPCRLAAGRNDLNRQKGV
jgi:hypothetical protein